MKLYNSIGPNPRFVRMIMLEKGIEMPMEDVDLRGGENRQEEFLKVNPSGQCPALQLDNGSILAEVTAIAEYLDEVGGGASLVGDTPEERAETRMWTRRADLNIVEPMLNGFRYSMGLKMFESRMRCLPEAAEGLKAQARDKLIWLNGLMDGKQYMAGDRMTMADIFLFCMLDFAAGVGQKLDPEWTHLQAWFDRMASRPSAAASA